MRQGRQMMDGRRRHGCMRPLSFEECIEEHSIVVDGD